MLRLSSLFILAVSLFLGCVSIGLFGEDAVDTCGGEKYGYREQICEDGILKNPCGNGYYGPRIQFCFDNAVFEKCTDKEYNPLNQKCEGGIVFNKCGNEYYNSIAQFCSNDEIYNMCNSVTYNVEMYICKNDILLPKCGNESFDPFSEYCVNDIIKDKEKFIDTRDDKKYKYVYIGYQTWMAENLRYETSNTKCYDDNPDNCEIYGVLYDWNTAKTACPVGWHLPNDTEWNTLKSFVGSGTGTRLMANSNLWISGKGTDDFGFTALPSGYFYTYFLEIGNEANFWSATAGTVSGSAHMRFISYFRELLSLQGLFTNNSWVSIRCVKGCGNENYILANQICENDILKIKCGTGNNYHDPETQFCNGNDVLDKCDGDIYSPAIQKCENDILLIKCGTGDNYYNSETQFCKGNEVLDKYDGIFTDNRDDKTYKYIFVGTQIWMAENLRYETSNTKCYNNNSDNCEIFGIMYDWNTAKTACPSGWHLPNDTEWNTLRDFVGSNNAGTKLKANSDIWASGKGTDDFNFTALPGGYYKDGSFLRIREEAVFWSATAGRLAGSAHSHLLSYNEEYLLLYGLYINSSLAYVRCVGN